MANRIIPLPTPGNGGTQRVLDRLALLSVPVLLGALGVVLWSLLNGVVEGVHANQDAIMELHAMVAELTATVEERTGDRWTATQEAQQQVIQALVDTAQNEQLLGTRETLGVHRDRLEALALDLAVSQRRLDSVEAMVGTVLGE